QQKTPEYYVAAYIWPSCHDEETSRKIWQDGTGEWEVIRKGNPRFDGHYQPRQPLWGYEMDDDPKVMEKWIDAATDHGVNVFIFDWYWYEGSPFLENSLNNGFLKAQNNEKMQFYLMWANHDMPWGLINVHKYGNDKSLLWKAVVDWENYKIIVDRVIKQYFKQPNYFKIDGKPVFSIFAVSKLLESFGGSVEETRKALDYFRDEVKKAGFPGLHLQWNPGIGRDVPEKHFAEQMRSLGFDSMTFYNMGGNNEDYLVYGKNSIKIRERMDAVLDIPFFPCVSVGWDDSPRFPKKEMRDIVHRNVTPQGFAMLLQKAKEYADSHPEQPKILVINAWNEWIEGSYLLPDMLNGFGYLEAVKEVIADGKYDKYMKQKLYETKK
ncbi:MAG: glycoside hydrolase family 99-like domain-containing protein, partial [Planctomycetaceae bacterium]|nr:glycoside hydrolase family 99-like domain-containing protein [Planctomycetaceae bacterium]